MLDAHQRGVRLEVLFREHMVDAARQRVAGVEAPVAAGLRKPFSQLRQGFRPRRVNLAFEVCADGVQRRGIAVRQEPGYRCYQEPAPNNRFGRGPMVIG